MEILALKAIGNDKVWLQGYGVSFKPSEVVFFSNLDNLEKLNQECS